jgi:hypothetical protein
MADARVSGNGTVRERAASLIARAPQMGTDDFSLAALPLLMELLQELEADERERRGEMRWPGGVPSSAAGGGGLHG